MDFISELPVIKITRIICPLPSTSLLPYRDLMGLIYRSQLGVAKPVHKEADISEMKHQFEVESRNWSNAKILMNSIKWLQMMYRIHMI
jgi:hypothetical protein